MEYILGVTVGKQHKGKVSSSEIGLPVSQSGYVLPCGGTGNLGKNKTEKHRISCRRYGVL